MKTLVILAHPNIDSSVANKRWKEELEKYPDEILVHELYKEYPDGKIDVAKERKLIEQTGNIILQFPLYWFNCPSLLKKWFDEVWTYGWAFGTEKGAFENKKVGIAVTTGGIKERYIEGGTEPIHKLLAPFRSSVNYVKGISISEYTLHGAMPNALTIEELDNSAKGYVEYIRSNAK